MENEGWECGVVMRACLACLPASFFFSSLTLTRVLCAARHCYGCYTLTASFHDTLFPRCSFHFCPSLFLFLRRVTILPLYSLIVSRLSHLPRAHHLSLHNAD